MQRTDFTYGMALEGYWIWVYWPLERLALGVDEWPVRVCVRVLCVVPCLWRRQVWRKCRQGTLWREEVAKREQILRADDHL